MKIAVYSDLHDDFGVPFIIPSEVIDEVDVVILAGDIGTIHSVAAHVLRLDGTGVEIIYVTGNHEYYHTTIDDMDAKLVALEVVHPHFNYLTEHTPSRIIDGVAFVGSTLWTDYKFGNVLNAMDKACGRLPSRDGFAMADYRYIGKPASGGITPEDILEIHNAQLSVINSELDRLGADESVHAIVGVSHHGISRDSISVQYASAELNFCFISELDEFVGSFDKLKFWVHGHVHQCFDYMIGDCNVVVNPRGYMRANRQPENLMFDPHKIIVVE
jgi:predicted phosphodiesterase